ncbi:AfsR/SARP family transcriptional regulator [Nocardia sp. XZ_19_385]|uniref:AfsR/SARP family transcriptional regulator n=1 Tax=Nocardia sp. XZ_19_385 TaxID=2769488 RepID=UPI001890571D|nr:AfsR/SARP family transcriptional regulator [Nocardia sp. XZ_19_385]
MSNTEMTLLRLSMLGPVEVWFGDEPVAIRQQKPQTLLAMLARNAGRVVSIDELIDGLWGVDDSPDSAVGAIRNFVWSVRRQLARHEDRADAVVSVRGGYRLALPVDTDAGAAERHRHAAEIARAAGNLAGAGREALAGLALWRGDPLSGLPGPWAAVERARLRRLRRTLQECSIEIDLAAGQFDRAIAEVEALRIIDPHCERLTALMMTALHDSGRRAEALAVYLEARQRLVTDLGLEPSAPLAALHQRILTDDGAPRRCASCAS